MSTVNISPRSRAIAEALLHAADKVGVERAAVRTTRNGYIVPVEVSQYYQKMVRGETEPESESTAEPETEPHNTGVVPEFAGGDPAPAPTPNEDWKNADIVTWAEANNVDLGGATKKSDMLAAIAAAGEKG